MGEFPSGQRGQTVNLLSVTSVVRIHLPPPAQSTIRMDGALCWYGFFGRGIRRGAVLENMPGACFPRDRARPQAGESTFPHQNRQGSQETCRFYFLPIPSSLNLYPLRIVITQQESTIRRDGAFLLVQILTASYSSPGVGGAAVFSVREADA